MKIVLAVAVLLVIAAGGFAWQRNQAFEISRAALADANAQLVKTGAELKSVNAQIAPLRKELEEQKAVLEQQRVDLSAAKGFLDAERASTLRIREELTAAKEQIAFMSRSRAAQSASPFSGPAYPGPVMIRPAPPTVIRAVPSAGTSQKNAVRAE